MRKLAGITCLSLGLVLPLAACGSNSSSTSTGNGGAEGFDPGNRITMIVPMAAGGGSDQSGRAIAKGLEEATGKNISVENLEGGNGAVGYTSLLSKKGDATTMLASETALVSLPISGDGVKFTFRDFTPIMKVGQDSTIVVARKDATEKTCTDVITAAKSGATKVGVSGGATGNDAIQFGLIEKDQNVKFERIPYDSGGEVIAGLMGQHIDVGLTNPGEVMGQLTSGDLKPLCVISDKRYEYPTLKDIPTAKEQGINVTFSQFRGFIMPGGLKDEAKQYWIDMAKKYAQSDAYKKSMEESYMQADPVFGDDFVAYLEQYEKDLKAGIGQS